MNIFEKIRKKKAAPSVLSSRALGDIGEKAVADYLKKRGYRLLCRNFTVRGGEIDIIAEKGAYIVFVEVKTRASDTDTEKYGRPGEAVNEEKIFHIRHAARCYLSAHPTDKKPRCDLAEVYLTLRPGKRPRSEIVYHEAAF